MMTNQENKQFSKLLSYVLRHNPSHLGIELDSQGWTSVGILLRQLNDQGQLINFDQLKHIVDTNSKKRFSFNEDMSLIRASQGHSVAVELNYSPQTPPELLYHGTAEVKVAQILEKGLLKMSRHHVHLSGDRQTAIQVGQRSGKAVVLIIKSLEMHTNGYSFFLSDNAVWLTDHVPPEFIQLP